jgi:hypothetical protein
MFKILLCHRRRGWFGARRFHRHWRDGYRQLVLELQPDLGYCRYAQLHQVCRANPLYQGIRATRSRLVTWLLARSRGIALPRASHDRATQSAERWDVVDELWYPSRSALVAALSSERGRAAARRLVAARAPWVRRSAIVTGDELVTAEPDVDRDLVRTVFCLRRVERLSRAQMQSHWTTDHRELVRRLGGELKFIGYDQLITDSDPDLDAVAETLGGSDGASYDGVAGLSFPAQWDLVKGLFDLGEQRANLTLVGDEITFIDGSRSTLVFGGRDEIYPAVAVGAALAASAVGSGDARSELPRASPEDRPRSSE